MQAITTSGGANGTLYASSACDVHFPIARIPSLNRGSLDIVAK